MKSHWRLYVLLIASVIVQVSFMDRILWCPDLILLIVVFTGIFRGRNEGALAGFTAGLIRGSFSYGTFLADIFIFTFVGAFSANVSRMFYKQSPAGEIVTTFTALIFVIISQVLFLNIFNDNNVSVLFLLSNNWRHLFSTVLFSPLFFFFIRTCLEDKTRRR